MKFWRGCSLNASPHSQQHEVCDVTERATTAPGVALLRDSEVDWVTLRPNIEAGRTITAAGITQLGGGSLRSTGQGGQILDWTLHYDEVLYVEAGELEVVSDGVSMVAGPGEAILIASGTTVTYRTKPHTKCFYVLYPIDWQQRTGISID